MKETEHLGLKLLEYGDVLSPVPLNKNAEILDTQLQQLRTLLAGGWKLEYGSYVGTNVYGSGNPNSLTFSFEPKFVWILPVNSSGRYITKAYLFNGVTKMFSNGSNSPGYQCVLTWGTKCASWYTTSTSNCAYVQCNSQAYTYYWFALG